MLVVNDDPTVRTLITKRLETLGYAALEGVDRMSGLTVLRSDARFGLLVANVGLPGGLNGQQLAETARQFPPNLKVLFITGQGKNAVVGSGHLAPGMRLLTKRFALEALATRIKAIIFKSPRHLKIGS